MEIFETIRQTIKIYLMHPYIAQYRADILVTGPIQDSFLTFVLEISIYTQRVQ